ncbi:type VII secretion protein EccE (plasmid) [Mycobacterium paragordonae]|uniref:Type VII secretion protein EccE n=2 Tax=Mycobacterium paragordonae TaxID=1389713 RepID=A0AAJ1W6G2_9MYCO|nr:type VII secretion protein EccE [Mycobacterium paragordonae]AYE99303.1 type VII secretion protein EccE [Mycobacterium paragordonae]MDP7739381.1 type VII secretion protein EccE [Mycobacterium paragordonae]PJE25165.1 MAG: type VII secretion protein EccE [Mycobacterium sp.]
MRPMLALGAALGWPRVVALFVADVALLWAGSAVAGRAGWWVAAVLAAAVSASALLRWRGAPLLTLAWRTVTSRGAAVGAPAGEAADYDRTYGQGPVGIRGVGPYLVAVVAVDGQAHSPSALDHHRVASLAKLPVAAVAQGLRQFDVTLDAIDIVSVGMRRASARHHNYAAVYSSLVGDHPAVGQRRTWLVARFDATASARAILWRESVAATLGAAAEWLAQELTSRRCPARVLTAEQIREADMGLLAGADPAAIRRGWGRLRHPDGYVQTYWMSPGDISSDTVDRLWTPDTDATAVTVQLRPAPDGATTVGVVVRYHTGGPLPEPPLSGLNPLTGRHDVGLAAGSITARAPLAVPSRELSDDAESLDVAIGATGIIVGGNATGHPLLVDLGSPTAASTVTVAGELALTVQVALRAAATGYQVLVHTDRPQQWKQVTGAGLALVGPGGLDEQLPPTRRRWMVVYDQVPGTAPQGAAVTVRTVPAGTASGADIHLEQEGARSAVIRTWAFRYRLRIDLDYERRLVDARPHRAA